MSRLVWDKVGEHVYETGVDRMVLYDYDKTAKKFTNGVAWSGVTAFNENPSGAEPTALYADNIKYLNLISAEEYGASLEAYTYPDEFEKHDGSKEIATGVYIAQQDRSPFGLCYRTLLGNDVDGTSYGYKLHLVYNATASPSGKDHQTVNDSPEAANPSWDISTTPVEVTGGKPTATVVIDSTKVDAGALAELEDLLYGTANTEAELPLPDEIAAIFGGAASGSVTLNTHAVRMTVGDTRTLTATTVPAGKTVTWSTGSSSVASVSGGVVTAAGAGNTIITATMTDEGVTYTDTCTVIVEAAS